MPMNTLLIQNCIALAINSRRRCRPLRAISKVSAGEQVIIEESGATKSGNG